jgi:hypothetical protein
VHIFCHKSSPYHFEVRCSPGQQTWPATS